MGIGDKDLELVGSSQVALKEGSEWEGGRHSDEGLEHAGEQSDLDMIRDGLIEREVGVVT